MSRTDIEPPINLGDKDLIRFFQGWNWMEKPIGPTTLDLRRVNFIAPWAVCLFAAYALSQKIVNRKHIRVLVHESSTAGSYIREAGLLSLLGQNSSKFPISTDRIVPLAQIKESGQIILFVKKVMDLLQLGDEELEGAVRYSLVELLRNVVQHSSSPIGGIAMAQYFPNTGLVDLIVADTGIGIKRTLEGNYPEINNDLKAIKFAMQPHVSGTFSPGAYDQMKDNAGLGLFFIKTIACQAAGGFFLGSGRFLADVWGDADGTQRKTYKAANRSGWGGTFALLQLRRESIGDFDGVLAICRRLAEEARKEPAKLNLDFIEEVPELEGLILIKVRDFEENVEYAAQIREGIIEEGLSKGRMVVIDFDGIDFATQSFVHALVYKVLRDHDGVKSALSIAHCSASTREAILAVAGYASAAKSGGGEIRGAI